MDFDMLSLFMGVTGHRGDTMFLTKIYPVDIRDGLTWGGIPGFG